MADNIAHLSDVIDKYKSFAPAGDSESSNLEQEETDASGARHVDTNNGENEARLTSMEKVLAAHIESLHRLHEQTDRHMLKAIDSLRGDVLKAEDHLARYTEAADRKTQESDAQISRALDRVFADGKFTRWSIAGLGLSLIGLFIAVVSLLQGTIDQQGAWLRQSVDRIERQIERIESAPIANPGSASSEQQTIPDRRGNLEPNASKADPPATSQEK